MDTDICSNNKQILMLLQSDFPPDIRLEKEIQALNENGYLVYLLCNNKSNKARIEAYGNKFRVLRLPHFRFGGRNLQPILAMPVFFNPIWLLFTIKLLIKYRISFIHVHDLPLALTAIMAAGLFRIPVIFDLHENYPAALEVWGKKGFLPILFRNPWLSRKLEQFCLRLADRIIVVIDEHKELLISRTIKPEKIFIVGNTVEIEKYSSFRVNSDIVAKFKKNYVLTYVGNFSPERELEVAIEAIKFLLNDIPQIKLVLVGEGGIRGDLENLVHSLDISDYVEFTGWVDFEETPSYIAAADICIIPQPSNELIDNGVPHKLFQYMLLEKPVLVSDSKAMARIVRETQCGEIFKSHSAKDFASAVLKIKNSKIDYGKNGKKAVFEKYNWRNSARELLRLYQELES